MLLFLKTIHNIKNVNLFQSNKSVSLSTSFLPIKTKIIIFDFDTKKLCSYVGRYTCTLENHDAEISSAIIYES